MRKVILLTMSIVITAPLLVSGQTIKEKVYMKLDTLLVRSGVLLKPSEFKKASDKKQTAHNKMRDGYRSQFDPLGDLYSNTLIKHELNNIDLSFWGSKIIESKKIVPLSVDEIPKLPTIDNNKQVLASQSNKFNLYYSLSELTSLAANIEASGGIQSIVHSSFKAGINYNKEKKVSFNVSAGTFENELGKIFYLAKQKQITPDQFLPVYTLWELYANDKEVKYEKDKPKFILRSFQGAIVQELQNAEYSGHLSSDATLTATTPSTPFVRAALESKFSWKKETSSRTSSQNCNLYLAKDPEFEELPSPNEIRAVWSYLSKQTSNNYSVTLGATSKNILLVTLSPVTSSIQYQLIKLDKNHLMKQFGKEKIITDAEIDLTKLEPDPLSGGVRVPIEFTYNKDFFIGKKGAVDYYDEVKKIRLGLGTPNGKDSLFKEFDVRFYSDGNLIPRLEKNQDPSAELKDDFYLWQFSIIFDEPPFSSEILAADILNRQITFKKYNQTLTNASYLHEAYCNQDATTKSKFNCVIKLLKPDAVLTPSDQLLECTLNTKPKVKIGGERSTYERSIDVRLRGIVPPKNNEILSSAIQYFESTEVLGRVIKESVFIGTTPVSELKEKYKVNGAVDYKTFGDYVARILEIQLDPTTNKYAVKTDIINDGALQDYLKILNKNSSN
jgi:hypothetical protein